MNRAVWLLLCAAVTFAAAGCPAPGVNRYPMEVSGTVNSTDYPPRAAGFEREKIISYAPGNNNVSVGYNMLTLDAQIASTIYVIRGAAKGSSPEDYFSQSKDALEQYHGGAKLLAEDTVALTKGGRSYTAQRAVYRYEDMFMGAHQPLYSVLMVWRSGDDLVKLRTTTPVARRNQLESNSLNLLNAVNWTAPPL